MTLPDFARHASAAAARIGAEFALLDADGYLFRISRDGRCVLSGAGGVCGYPVNSATAVAIARDKAHAANVLAAANLPVIPGALFFAHTRRAGLRSPGRETDDALRHAATLGYPVFVKPNLGALGNLAEAISSEDALRDWIARAAQEFESFLIQPVIEGEEHRVLVKDGRAIFHVKKLASALTGDGVSTLTQLLARTNGLLAGTGVSPWPEAALTSTGRALSGIPARGERIPLTGRRNLAAAGDIEHGAPDAPPALAELAVAASRAIGLRIAAVDMFDTSPAHDLSRLVVIEVNGNPGLRSLELTGHGDAATALWADMLNELLEAPHVRA
jgi:glutathione synthase/RimK-type ligase-like ATP-grasp enzyme